jgi:beta-phosphoglucomutase-like phosphatase (HAD superfamily)
MFSAIVFDFDGVIADSERLHLAAYQEVLLPLGVTLTREDYYARYLGSDDVGVFTLVGESQGWQMDAHRLAALVAEKGRVFDAAMESTDLVYPGAGASIERLAAAFPLGIASGALRHEIEAILRRAGLLRHFRFIVASGDTPQSKPAPDPYRRAAELHGVPAAACLAIEDSHWGIQSAKSAGLSCIAITNTYARAALTTADLVVESLEEITPELIASMNR